MHVSPVPSIMSGSAFYAYMLKAFEEAGLQRAELMGVPSGTHNGSAHAYWTFLSRPIEGTWVL